MDSDNQCPVSDGFDATPSGRRPHQDWWPNQLKLSRSSADRRSAIPMDESFNYAEEFKSLDLDAVEEGRPGVDDVVPGVVAGGLRSLRSVLHPHGLAQRGHVPDSRRSRRWRVRARSVSRRSTVGPTT